MYPNILAVLQWWHVDIAFVVLNFTILRKGFPHGSLWSVMEKFPNEIVDWWKERPSKRAMQNPKLWNRSVRLVSAKQRSSRFPSRTSEREPSDPHSINQWDWYIWIHLPLKTVKCVGKYTIRGSYRIWTMNFTTTLATKSSKYFSQLKLQLQSLSPPTLPEIFREKKATGFLSCFPSRERDPVQPTNQPQTERCTQNLAMYSP